MLREKLPDWHETYIDRLNKEYIALLSGKGSPSEKFSALNKRIQEDKRNPGVQLFQWPTEITYLVAGLMNENVVKEEDLCDLSKEFRSTVLQLVKSKPWDTETEEEVDDTV